MNLETDKPDITLSEAECHELHRRTLAIAAAEETITKNAPKRDVANMELQRFQNAGDDEGAAGRQARILELAQETDAAKQAILEHARVAFSIIEAANARHSEEAKTFVLAAMAKLLIPQHMNSDWHYAARRTLLPHTQLAKSIGDRLKLASPLRTYQMPADAVQLGPMFRQAIQDVLSNEP